MDWKLGAKVYQDHLISSRVQAEEFAQLIWNFARTSIQASSFKWDYKHISSYSEEKSYALKTREVFLLDTLYIILAEKRTQFVGEHMEFVYKISISMIAENKMINIIIPSIPIEISSDLIYIYFTRLWSYNDAFWKYSQN